MNIIFRISRVRVAPIKIPSNIYENNPIKVKIDKYGRYLRASNRTYGENFIRSTTCSPKIYKNISKIIQIRPAQIVVRSAACLKPFLSREPTDCPTSVSAACANPSTAYETMWINCKRI